MTTNKKTISAKHKLDGATLSDAWTTQKVLGLAKELIDELGDLSGKTSYCLLKITPPKHHKTVISGLNKIRKDYWEARGEAPPALDDVC